jgi:tetratricopeptide (TPR) repeat protein
MLATITEALRRGDAAAAVRAARAAVSAEPENPKALQLLGLSLQKSGDLPGARNALDQAIALAPTDANLHFTRGSLELDTDAGAARAALQQAVMLNPNQGQAYTALVHLAIAAGDREEAQRQLKLAERVDADAVDVRLAAGCLAQANGDADTALKEFTAAAEREPKNPFAQLSLGLAYLNRRMWPFAEQALKNTLALQPENSGVVRALVLCQLENGDVEAGLATLDAWLERHPGDALLMVRAQIQVRRGLGDIALADCRARLAVNPTEPLALRMVVSNLLSQGQDEAATALMEAALAREPNRDDLWHGRLALPHGSPEEVRTTMTRWVQTRPESAKAWDIQAQMHEEMGELDAAEESAQRAMALGSRHLLTQLIIFRAQLRRDPALALTTIDALVAKAQAPETKGKLVLNRGLALDRLGRYADAAVAWRSRNALTPAQARLPAARPAELAPSGSATGTVLWAPAGLPLEQTFAALEPILGRRLCLDRMRRLRNDGFDGGPIAANAEPGSAESWRQGVMRQGQAPEEVVDWLPFWDMYTAAALSGARVVALLVDPRDAFLNWMVFGSTPPYPFLADSQASASWLAQCLDAFAMHLHAHPDDASMVMMDDVEQRPEAIAEALKLALALPATPDAAVLGQPFMGSGQMPLQFPPGHWRNYQNEFAAEFATLTPVAQKLGYPA